MEEIKRQLNSNSNNYVQSKRQKIQATTNEIRGSCFEDLSNELIYEIFEYLDYFHVYEAFVNLNTRFYNLVINSNLPIKINISSMSKSTCQRYNKDIIEPNMDRIISFHVSNVFTYNIDFSSLYKLRKFRRLETLILHNVESEYVENLLNQLPSLSLLSSLVITFVSSVTNTIFCQIFRLSALRYCKFSFTGWTYGQALPVCINANRSIEHLVITNEINRDELDSLLSYVPQLRRLFVCLLPRLDSKQTKISPSPLNNLTHVSFKITYMRFDGFIQSFIDQFLNIELLYLTVQGYNIDQTYLDANRWEQAISTYIPKLRVFDFVFDRSGDNADDLQRIETNINQFTSPFWIERQWFFAHHLYRLRYGNRVIFYSINPYRRKHYTLYKQQSDETASLDHYGSHLNSVQYVHIESGDSIVNCTNYFPNAIEIIFERCFSINRASIVTNLNRILPLKQLKKLVIKCPHFSVQRLIKILCHTPNIHTLELKSMACYKKKDDYVSIQQSEDFQLVSNRNTIQNVICDVACNLEQIKLLVALCPQLNSLTMNRRSRNLESIVRFLLDRTNANTGHLCLLCFSRAWNNLCDKLDQLIKSETLLNDYTLKQIDWNLYLWW